MQERWRRETGGDRDRLKEYEMPIPLLHSLRLNPTNHILGHLAGVFPGLEQFYHELSVVKEDYHGGEKFEGEFRGISLAKTATSFDPISRERTQEDPGQAGQAGRAGRLVMLAGWAGWAGWTS